MSIPNRVKIARALGWTDCQPTYNIIIKKGWKEKKQIVWVGKPPFQEWYHYQHIPPFDRDSELYLGELARQYEARK